MTNFRRVGFLYFATAAMLGTLGLTGCSTDDADPQGSGGSGGSATGGSGGGGDSGGSSGSGGSGGSGGTPTMCTPQPPPATGLLMDFETNATAFGNFTDNFSGGIFHYPNIVEGMPEPPFPLTSTVADGVWTVSGTVGDYSGFGFFFVCRADVSMYDGIGFTISGTIGTPPLTMRVSHQANVYDPPGGENPQGTCVPTNPSNPTASCADPKIEIEVTEEPQTYELEWSDFTGGLPEDTPNPAQFMNFGWYFAWPASANYDVNVVIDDVRFLGGPSGTGGSGGTGGTSGGGSGGGGTGGSGGADGGMGGAP